MATEEPTLPPAPAAGEMSPERNVKRRLEVESDECAPPTKKAETDAAKAATAGEADAAPESRKPEGKEADRKDEPLHVTLKRQVEYYFGDANLKHDSFFQDKIKLDPEGWVNLRYVLSCPKVKALGVTETDIVECLRDSHIEVKADHVSPPVTEAVKSVKMEVSEAADPSGSSAAADDKDNAKEAENNVAGKAATEPDVPPTKHWVRRPTPPPTYVARRPRGAYAKGSLKKPDYHLGGCLLEVSELPEDCSWQTVKEEVVKKLPNGAKVAYVSPVDNASVFLYVKPFEDDRATLSSLSIELSGKPTKVELAGDERAKTIIKKLPSNAARQRLKFINRKKADFSKKPLKLGGCEFKSIDHLRNCCRELLQKFPSGHEFKDQNTNAYKTLKELITYHPKSAHKARDLSHFKVGTHKCENKTESLCFFAVRNSGEDEEFSYLKCVTELTKRAGSLLTPPSAATKEEGAAKEEEGRAKEGDATMKEEDGRAKEGEATMKEEDGTAKEGEATVKEAETSDGSAVPAA
eukprot:GHVU01028682.1.p2 GENE.GHVU01028682.1~~GHVU01028682.1.p2  ORF type:complete len:522 (+),score=148.20 GHVU01028682.1:765-2330(+)